MERYDPFYYDQPPLLFVDELKTPFYRKKPDHFGVRARRAYEADAHGIYIDECDFSGEDLLETVAFEFARFTKLYEIDGKAYPVQLKRRITGTFEEYTVNVLSDRTEVYANDTEGIRRALVYIMDEINRREGAYLPLGEITKRPVIKSRITRGFFSPTNRPPKNGDELSDDIDYYPDEYLNRLMHDGTNGIWIYTSFKALLSSAYFPEFGEGGEERIKKLRKVVAKCKRYGIKVYVFAIEPMNLSPEMAKRHPEVLGADVQGGVAHPFCLMTEVGRAYITEATEKLFRLVPDLGGYMDITEGERVTTCASSTNFKTCPRCGKMHIGESLAYNVNLIREGIRRAGTGAEFISWTYGHRLWAFDDIREYVRGADDDIMLMQNFDDMGYEEQLGKTRQAVDYWLSYVGPSELFKITAKEANDRGKHMFAKMQVCCSHELATVPYIPTPGLVFEKYKGAYEYKVEGVLQCWYFGNYPSIMSKAAGELSFMSDFSDKRGFLKTLAATYYGESRADNTVLAWEKLEAGYRCYPINILFSYYGPMHDGVVWELPLKPRNNRLPRTWKLQDPPDGDRIEECLRRGHTLDEAITLSDMIVENWTCGLRLLELPEDDEMYSIVKALELLFKAGSNILKFFKERGRLGMGEGDPSEILARLRKITETQIEYAEAMIPLCEKDVRLGYHSEAEGYKFFPKKLRDTVEKLRRTLDTEYPEVENRIKLGLAPLEFYTGKASGENIVPYAKISSAEELSSAPLTELAGGHGFRVGYDGDSIILELHAKTSEVCKVLYEFEPLKPEIGVLFASDGKLDLFYEATSHESVFGEKIEKELSCYTLESHPEDGGFRYILKASRKAFGIDKIVPMRLRLSVGSVYWKSPEYDEVLARWDSMADTFGWIV